MELKRSQHFNEPYRNIAERRNMLHAFSRPVARGSYMLCVVGLSLKLVKFEPTTLNKSQQGGQTRTTCCAQQCCDMVR